MTGMNLGKMMRQVQRIQEQLMRIQEEVGSRTVEASVGGGAVRVTVNGKMQVESLCLEPEVVDPDDIEMLQDLIVAAVNEGIRKAQEMVSTEMAKVTGGLKLPPFLAD